MRRWGALVAFVLAVMPAIPARAGETVTTTGLVWDQQGALSLPLPETHQAWPDEILAMTSDGARIHALWANMPGRSGVQYRWSTDGVTWSAPEDVGADQDAIASTSDGTVYALGPSASLARRSSSGVWTSTTLPSSPLNKLVMQTSRDDRVWIAYTNQFPWNSGRPVLVSSLDAATGDWSAVVDTGLRMASDFVFDLPSISMSIGDDGTPWVVLAQGGTTVSVAHRASAGWVREQAAPEGNSVASLNGLAVGARADGSIAMVYWDGTAPGSWTLQWALRKDGVWHTQGALQGRTSGWAVHATTARAPNGDVLAMWEECNQPGSWGWCFPVTSRLRADGTWTTARIVGTFPRITRSRFSLAFAPNGLGVMASNAPDTFGEAGAWIANERADGAWTDQRALAPSTTIAGAPDAGSIQVSAAANDGLAVAWRQQTADGLGVADESRTPHIALAFRDAHGRWSSPERVDDGMAWRPWWQANITQYDVEPDVVGIETSTTGATYVIWREVDADPDMTTRTRLLGRLRAPDGSWSPVEEMPVSWNLPSSGEYQALMSFDSSGRLWVLDPYGEDFMRAPDGTWTTQPAVLPGATLRLSGLGFAVAPDGTQYAQYAVGVQTSNVYVVSRAPVGNWSTPERVDDGTPKLRTSGGLALAGSTLISAFAQEVSSGVSRTVVASRAIASSTWGSAIVTPSIAGLVATDVDVTDDGSWWVAFQTCHRKEDGITNCANSGAASMHVVQRTPQARWHPPLYVSAPDTGRPNDISSLRLVGRHVPVATWGFIGNHANPLRLGADTRVIARAVPNAHITLDLDRTGARAGECIHAVVTITDGDDGPMNMLEVAWVLTPNAGSGGSLTWSAGRTERDICWTRTGSMTLTILLTQGAPVLTRSLSWSANTPAQITTTAPSNPSVGTGATVSALVMDAYGNGAAVPVSWTFVSGPGAITTSDSHTDVDGRAKASVTSTQSGDTTLDIAVDGTSLHQAVTFTWQAGPAVALRFDDDDVDAPAGTLTQVIAYAVDVFGNAASAQYAQTSWSATGEGVFVGDPVTDASSEARARGTSLMKGDSIITVTLRSTGQSATARVHWT